jgi:hypothetical protein
MGIDLHSNWERGIILMDFSIDGWRCGRVLYINLVDGWL